MSKNTEGVRKQDKANIPIFTKLFDKTGFIDIKHLSMVDFYAQMLGVNVFLNPSLASAGLKFKIDKAAVYPLSLQNKKKLLSLNKK